MNIKGMRVLSVHSSAEISTQIESLSQSLSLESIQCNDISSALASLSQTKCDLVIIQSVLAQEDNGKILKTLRNVYAEIPIVILLKESDDTPFKVKALHLGADGFLDETLHPSLFQATLFPLLKLKKAESLLQSQSLLVEHTVKELTTSFKDAEHEALLLLGHSYNKKAVHTSTNSTLMAHTSKLLAKDLGLNDKIQDVAFYASQLYDLGKVEIADEILLKKGILSGPEREEIKSHAKKGYDSLKYSKSAYLKAGAVISYSHHEKFDGTGYPLGLQGETIPILGRIVAVLDVFFALIASRPYREAWSVKEASDFLVSEKSKHFDPKVVEIFMAHLDEILSLYDSFKE